MTKSMNNVLVAVTATLAWCGGAWADQTWLCAVNSAVAVDEDGTVGPPDLGGRERPTFFRVDPTRKELTLLAPQSRRGEVTTFDTVHESHGLWVFNGVENGRGLSLIITAEGRMSLSVIGDGVIWSVFGHTLPEGEPTTLADSDSSEASARTATAEPESDAAEIPEGESAEPSADESSETASE